MTKSLRKNIFREIKGTWKRFLSIALMAFLGAGFFAGINASSTDMQLSCDTYLDQQNCFDLEIVSTQGLTQDDVDAVLKVNGISGAVGAYSENVMVDIGDGDEKVKLMTIPEEGSINQLYLLDGEMATQADECVVPQSLLDITGKSIGDQLNIMETLEDEEESSFRYTNLTITGVVDSPLFLYGSSGSNERSTGAVADYLYVPAENIVEDYFTELYLTVDGAAELDSFDDAYETLVGNAEVLVKAIADTREQARYDQITGDANAEIDDAQAELDDKAAEGQQEIDDAQQEIDRARKSIEDGRAELERSRLQANRQFADAQSQIDIAAAKVSSGWKDYRSSAASAKKQRDALTEQQKNISDKITELEQQRAETEQSLAALQEKRAEAEQMLQSLQEQRSPLADGIAQYQAQLDAYTEQLEQVKLAREQLLEAGMDTTELDVQIEQLTAGIAQIEEEKAGYDTQLEQLDAGIAEAEDGVSQLDAGITQAQDGLTQLDDGIAQANAGLDQIADGIGQIDRGLASGKAQLQQAEAELNAAKRELASAKARANSQLDAAQLSLDEGQQELEDGIAELAVQKADFDQQIADAQKEIDEAREAVGDINLPTWYVMTREGNDGIASFDQDSSNLKKIGFTFPLIFFLVAVLISLSSMTRMVEEQRGLIGTLQALGYSGRQIAAKYLIYAATATISGSIIGELICMRVLPEIVWNIYRSFYHMPLFMTPIDWLYGTVGLLACTGCIVGATAVACCKEIRQRPAQLMRPKAPNPGKRVLIERITPLWKQFNFSQKVTLRNLFRYKKRLFMTVCGIAGCAALITTGYGLRDSIVALIPLQYGDVMHYDMIAVASTDVKQDTFDEMSDELQAEPVVETALDICAESVHVVTEEGKDHELELFVPSDSVAFQKYISLLDTESEQELELSGDEVVLTQQIAEILGVSVGDTVSLRREDGIKADTVVGAIVHNYLSHYAFLSKEGYENLYQETAQSNAFLLHTTEQTGEELDSLTKKLNSDSRYTTVSSTQAAKDSVNDRFGMLDQVVWILIVAAAALAMVVLYNLSNINISERIRELATIKVLGFYDIEVYQYNTRESIVLTLLGTLIGLGGGYWLTYFILKTMEMQGIVFEPTVAWKSYLLAGLITIVFATVISLKKIDMVEALKSVE
ncbi:MAG: hypothetical protein Q4D42_11995 [Eubacteriales bacterium]|nr:hypothetical protein [Eubacteriales bacterium]